MSNVGGECSGCGIVYTDDNRVAAVQPDGIEFEERPMPKTISFEDGPEVEFTEFATGAVRSNDADGTRYDLISPIGLRMVAEAYAEGSAKYGDFNWEKGMPLMPILNHLLRHVYLFLSGDRSEPHLGHAAWNALAACHSWEAWPHLNDGSLRGPNCQAPQAKLRQRADEEARRRAWDELELAEDRIAELESRLAESDRLRDYYMGLVSAADKQDAAGKARTKSVITDTPLRSMLREEFVKADVSDDEAILTVFVPRQPFSWEYADQAQYSKAFVDYHNYMELTPESRELLHRAIIDGVKRNDSEPGAVESVSVLQKADESTGVECVAISISLVAPEGQKFTANGVEYVHTAVGHMEVTRLVEHGGIAGPIPFTRDELEYAIDATGSPKAHAGPEEVSVPPFKPCSLCDTQKECESEGCGVPF